VARARFPRKITPALAMLKKDSAHERGAMKADNSHRKLRSLSKDGGFTFIDLMVVVVIVVLLGVVGFRLLAPRRSQVSASRISCVAQLKQIGLAARLWSRDHGDKFPWQVSTNQGGTLEVTGAASVVAHFQALSNELVSPKVLVCGLDAQRAKATNWATLALMNLSYFVALDAEEARPQTILTGDRNITTNRPGKDALVTGLLTLTTNATIRWTADLHQHAGNVGLADGSAQQVNNDGLQAQLRRSEVSPVRWVLP
jgi:type II secretory pathway pseudopilin PulG